jgi:hypothetical protein
MFLEQLLGVGNSAWVSVAMLCGLLVTLIFRPNSIRNPFLFRTACWLFGLSMILSPLLNMILNMLRSSFMGAGMRPNESELLVFCAAAVGPIMHGVSILCGLLSLLPSTMSERLEESGPVKHPLE